MTGQREAPDSDRPCRNVIQGSNVFTCTLFFPGSSFVQVKRAYRGLRPLRMSKVII